jgi:RluA family pseudouridine synthase
VGQTLKLSSPATGQFWEIPVLWEDGHLLALNKPGGLRVSPDRLDPARPNLTQLLHRGIQRGAPWAKERGLVYLMIAHRLDFGTSGVLLLAKSKPALIALADQFGSDKPERLHVALVRGSSAEPAFAADAPLGPHPLQSGEVRVDPKGGRRARTEFVVRERFPGAGCMLLECRPRTNRAHQIAAHLKHLRFPIIGDEVYGGPPLLLSSLKASYRLKPGRSERPLIAGVALHAEALTVAHPVGGAPVRIAAPWPKDLMVAVKYLRRYSPS